jgi:tRNA(Met) C34 N-acetyltransferase TmcA
VWCTFDRRQRRVGVRAKEEIPEVVEFARERLGFEPDERQAEVLGSKAKRGILNCTRQWGKSTVAGIKAIHKAYTRPGSLVVVASPTDRQSAEFLGKAGELIARLGIRPRGDGKNPRSVLLPNGSRIVGLPGTEGTIRGFSAAALLVIDEAARAPDSLYKALRPMLAVSGGDLWLLSTPRGRTGFFTRLGRMAVTSGRGRW